MAKSFYLSGYDAVIPGIVSAAASFSVCLTVVLFPDLRHLRYIELVFYVAINDFLASIGMALGNTENGTAACWYQGISSNVNYLSAILWSAVITYQVWRVVCQRSIIKDLTYAHIVCWGIPTLVTILPLSTSTYANPDDEANWCFVANRSNSPKWSLLFWFIVAFYGWVWLTMLFNTVLIGGMVYRFHQMQVVPERVVATVRKLLLYPIIITLCWSLSTFVDLYTVFNPDPTSSLWYFLDGLSKILAISQGFMFSLVFFGMNPIVRQAWMGLFQRLGCAAIQEPEEATEDSKSVSMVSVSMNESGTESRSRTTGTGSAGGTLGTHADHRSSGNSWNKHSLAMNAAIQQEVDYLESGGGPLRLSQRLSILDFLRTDGDGKNLISGAGLTTAIAKLSVERSPPARKHKEIDLSQLDEQASANASFSVNGSVSVNPMMSMAVNDSEDSAALDGTGTGHGFESDVERGSALSGITAASVGDYF